MSHIEVAANAIEQKEIQKQEIRQIALSGFGGMGDRFDSIMPPIE